MSSLYYYYWYSALGPVWAETRAQSGDWYGSGTLHPGQVHRGSLPLLSPYKNIDGLLNTLKFVHKTFIVVQNWSIRCGGCALIGPYNDSHHDDVKFMFW